MKNFIKFCLILCFLFLPLNIGFGEEIEDEFVNEYFKDKDLTLKIEDVYFEDDFALLQSPKGNIKVERGYFEDKFAKEYFKGRKFKQRIVRSYDYTNPGRKLKIHSANYISTSQKIKEGEYVKFLSLNSFKAGGKFYPKNTPVMARVETISKRGLRGVPSDIILGNFEIEGSKDVIDFEISKRGANRSIWIYPASLLSGFIIPGSGIALNFIQGGHAKIKPNEIFEIELD